MIVTMAANATDADVQRLQRDLRIRGYESHWCRFGDQVALAVPGAPLETITDVAADHPVRGIVQPDALAPLASREATTTDSVVSLGGQPAFGPGTFVVIAGPCAVESRGQLNAVADAVAAHGAGALRGGAYKPRTSPYAFQGLARQGLELLAETSMRTGLPVVTEVVEPQDVALVAAHADMLQIGTRNAHNFALLREAGRSGLPVLIKRGFACTVDEWLQAAEYVLREGNPNVVLCERGIRTFETRSRFTLDLTAVALVKRLSHLPVIVDPSHATGLPELVGPMTLAAAAAGADGALIDVHHSPSTALCDGTQALHPTGFENLMLRLELLLPCLGRALATVPSRLGDKCQPAS
jgi:3-deoxy-7-phosphoheptulonate synthase